MRKNKIPLVKKFKEWAKRNFKCWDKSLIKRWKSKKKKKRRGSKLLWLKNSWSWKLKKHLKKNSDKHYRVKILEQFLLQCKIKLMKSMKTLRDLMTFKITLMLWEILRIKENYKNDLKERFESMLTIIGKRTNFTNSPKNLTLAYISLQSFEIHFSNSTCKTMNSTQMIMTTSKKLMTSMKLVQIYQNMKMTIASQLLHKVSILKMKLKSERNYLSTCSIWMKANEWSLENLQMNCKNTRSFVSEKILWSSLTIYSQK